jgi:hypothetical protein
MLGKTVGLMFRKDQVAVHLDVKNAVGAFDEFRLRSELPLDGVRQTGGFGQVVSFYTVGDGYLHHFLL